MSLAEQNRKSLTVQTVLHYGEISVFEDSYKCKSYLTFALLLWGIHYSTLVLTVGTSDIVLDGYTWSHIALMSIFAPISLFRLFISYTQKVLVAEWVGTKFCGNPRPKFSWLDYHLSVSLSSATSTNSLRLSGWYSDCSAFEIVIPCTDRLCGLVVRVLGYRSGGPGSILGTTKKKVVGLNGVHSASWVQLRSYLIEK
jgi:hypothetical protein